MEHATTEQVKNGVFIKEPRFECEVKVSTTELFEVAVPRQIVDLRTSFRFHSSCPSQLCILLNQIEQKLVGDQRKQILSFHSV